jgi:hypothetical protein
MLAYFLYLVHRRRSFVLLSGVLGGLAASSQSSSGFVVPYIWLLLILDFFLEAPSDNPAHKVKPWAARFKQLLLNGLLWGGGAVGIFWLIWPSMWLRPFASLETVLRVGYGVVATDSIWHGPVFFWGRILQDDVGLFFYPVVYAFRTTPLTWLGVVAALMLLVSFILRHRTSRPFSENTPLNPPTMERFGSLPETGRAGEGLNFYTSASSHQTDSLENKPSTVWGWPWVAVGVALLLAHFGVITLELSAILSKVDRYLITIFPALNILSAVGVAAMVQGVVAWWPSRSLSVRRGIMVGLLTIILLAQLSFSLPYHPYFFTYWNPLVGGPPVAARTLPVGSGEGLDQVVNYANQLPDATEAGLICGASQPWCSLLFKGKTLRFADYTGGRWLQADYASFYISQLQRGSYPPEVVNFFMAQEPLFRAEMNGVTYAWLYQVPQVAYFAGAFNELAGLGQLYGYSLSPPALAAEPANSAAAVSVNKMDLNITSALGIRHL